MEFTVMTQGIGVKVTADYCETDEAGTLKFYKHAAPGFGTTMATLLAAFAIGSWTSVSDGEAVKQGD